MRKIPLFKSTTSLVTLVRHSLLETTTSKGLFLLMRLKEFPLILLVETLRVRERNTSSLLTYHGGFQRGRAPHLWKLFERNQVNLLMRVHLKQSLPSTASLSKDQIQSETSTASLSKNLKPTRLSTASLSNKLS